MTPHWSDAIPQMMQQHGGPPKHAAEPEEKPPEPLDILLSTLDQPGRFATSPAFEPKVTRM